MILNRFAVALCVFILGIIHPFVHFLCLPVSFSGGLRSCASNVGRDAACGVGDCVPAVSPFEEQYAASRCWTERNASCVRRSTLALAALSSESVSVAARAILQVSMQLIPNDYTSFYIRDYSYCSAPLQRGADSITVCRRWIPFGRQRFQFVGVRRCCCTRTWVSADPEADPMWRLARPVRLPLGLGHNQWLTAAPCLDQHLRSPGDPQAMHVEKQLAPAASADVR